MYEGGIRVPMCAVWPEHIKPGQQNEVCSGLTMDLYATACAAAGVSVTHEIDGLDLSAILQGEENDLPERTLFWMRRDGGPIHGMAYYAVRRGDWKLCQGIGPASPLELFNLADDPMEERPLPQDHPKYQELSQALKEHIIHSGHVPWQKPVT